MLTWPVLGTVTLGGQVDPNVLIPSLLAAAATVIAALLGRQAISKAKARRAAGAEPEEEPTVSPSPLAAFAGTQNEFMALVVQDSVNLRAELSAALLAHRAELADVRAELGAELADVRAELERTRADHSAFSRAVRRYLEQLAHAWPSSEPMPFPEASDAPLLERVLPRRRRPA